MRQRASGVLSDRRGTAAVELALISPLVLLLLAGVIDFGRMLHDKIELAAVVASAGEYALLSAASINSGNAANLAATLSGIVANSSGNACAGGTLAGKFVTITGSRRFSAIFGRYGFISDRVLRESTIVQSQ